MLRNYAELLREPGALGASTAACIARLPLAMSSLGIVLLVSEKTGSFGTAGFVVAFYVAASGVSGPLQGRLADRLGQPVVLTTGALLLTTGLVGFVLTYDSAPIGVACVAALIAGLGAPQAGAFIRARWSHLLEGRRRQLQAAFALEGIVDEITFIIGPILISAIATVTDARWGLLSTAAFGLLGSMSLAAQRESEPPRSVHSLRGRPPLGASFVASMVVLGLFIGTLFGATEVTVVAFLTDSDARHLTGAVLAVWSGGSLLAGLIVGTTRPPRSAMRRLRGSLALLALTFAPLLLVDAVLWLAVGLFVSGLAIAPAMIAAISLVEATVPRERLTEGVTWLMTAVGGGVAPGAAATGQVIDAWTPTGGFLVAMIAASLATLAAFISSRSRRVSEQQAAEYAP